MTPTKPNSFDYPDCGAKLVNEVTETRARMADIHDKLMDLRKALNRRSGSLLEKQITDAAICLTNAIGEARADNATSPQNQTL